MTSDAKVRAAKLLEHLGKLKDDRGAMADLRSALSEARRPRAWPWLGPAGGIGDVRIETVAGLFAYFGENNPGAGNLGETCRRLRDSDSFDARFRRLLACDYDEICDRLRPVVLMAKAKSVPVDFEQLYVDLRHWESAKVRWAQKYWEVEKEGEAA